MRANTTDSSEEEPDLVVVVAGGDFDFGSFIVNLCFHIIYVRYVDMLNQGGQKGYV